MSVGLIFLPISNSGSSTFLFLDPHKVCQTAVSCYSSHLKDQCCINRCPIINRHVAVSILMHLHAVSCSIRMYKQNQMTDNTRHARHPLILNVAHSRCSATPPYRQHCFMYNLKYRIVSDKKKVKQSRNRPRVAQRVPGGLGSQISWHSAHEGGEVVSLTHRPPLPPGNVPGNHFH